MGNQNSTKQKPKLGFTPTKVIPYQDFPFARVTPNEKDTTTPIAVLPKEAFFSIASRLSEKDLLSLSRCCKKLHERLNDSGFWVALAKERKHLNFERYEKFNHISGKHWYYQQCKLDVIAEPSSTVNEKDYAIHVFLAGCPKVGRTKLGQTLIGLPYSEADDSAEVTTRTYQGSFKYCGRSFSVSVEERHSSEKLMMLESLFKTEWILLVYSVADRASFDELKSYFNEASARCVSTAKMILVSTCNDLPKEQHQVKDEEGRRWAEQHGNLPFVQISSKTLQGIQHLQIVIMKSLFAAELKKRIAK
mmetsp:Transcript_3179/g.4369  ORF Transcript_3179/g.4369 Transcript_3179/m.4369 type:complete len:305 (-) Transcript_3179:83-997(-)